MRVTCTIKKRSDMDGYLKHEFSKHPLPLFDRGAMRKADKSVLAHNLKAAVVPISTGELGHKYYVVDGGHLLHIVKKKTLAVLESGYWDVPNVFLKTNPNHDKVARAGEMFLIKSYRRKHICKTLEKLRNVLCMQKKYLANSSSKIFLPTSDAARFHSYRADYAVQEWLGKAQDV